MSTKFGQELGRDLYLCSVNSKLLKTMDPMLSQQDFLVGNEFTAADIINGYTLRLASNIGLLNGAEGTKNVCVYYNRLEEREAFQKAISS